MIYIPYRPLGTDLFKPGRLCETEEEEPFLENSKTLKNGETNKGKGQNYRAEIKCRLTRCPSCWPALGPTVKG